MTDEQIIKALECCSQENKCQECPYGAACLDEKYISVISIDALDLINRQKAEIKVYKEANILIAQQRDSRDKDIANLESEIERLKWSKSTSLKEFAEKAKPIIEEMVDVMFDDNISRCFVNNCRKPTSLPCDSEICIEENKAFWTTKIDNLLKEMENGTEKQTKKDQNNNPKIINHVMKSMLKW